MTATANPFEALTQLPAVLDTMRELLASYDQRLKLAEAQKPLKRTDLLDYLGVSDRQLLEYRRRGLPTYGSRDNLIAFKGEVDDWLREGHVNRHRR